MNTQSFVSRRSVHARPLDRPSRFVLRGTTRPATLSGKELQKIVAEQLG